MRIKNCLIITTDQSRIEVDADGGDRFSGNLVLSETLLEDEADAFKRWREIRQRQDKQS